MALPSARNDFVEDDVWVVAQRPILHHPPSLSALLLEPYWPRTFGGRLWRPAVLASWALDYRLSESPHWFHAVNVLWAALAAAALGLLAASLTDARIGLAAGLLFAVHPVHVEATAGVVGRAELMAATGYAIALLCALRAGRQRWWLVGVTLGSALSIASKEHAATLPMAIVLVLLVRKESWRAMIAAAVSAALPIAIYFALRSHVTGGVLGTGGLAPGLEGLTAPERAWAMLGISAEWWRLLMFPVRLSADYSTAQLPVSTGITLRHVVAVVLWAGAGWAAWRTRRTAPGVALGLAWLALTLVPVSNVLVPTEIVLAERTLFLPSWGAMLALACGIMLLPAPAARPTVLAAVLVLGAARSIARTGAWRDVDHWYAALQRDAPLSYRTLWMRGDEAFEKRQWGTGERLLRASMAAAPGLPGPAEDLARFYAAARLFPQAETLLRHSMELNRARSRPWILLEDLQLVSGDTAAAVRSAEESARRFPDDPDVLVGTLNALLEARRCDLFRARLAAPHAALLPAADSSARAHALSCESWRPGR
ncbi:MAG: tetratricopeptide repeat protein [Gemmatimonadales bacterium]